MLSYDAIPTTWKIPELMLQCGYSLVDTRTFLTHPILHSQALASSANVVIDVRYIVPVAEGTLLVHRQSVLELCRESNFHPESCHEERKRRDFGASADKRQAIPLGNMKSLVDSIRGLITTQIGANPEALGKGEINRCKKRREKRGNERGLRHGTNSISGQATVWTK